MASEIKTSDTVEVFSYIARDKNSGVVRGEIKAMGETIVLNQLNKMGLDPISVSVIKPSIFENFNIV